MAHSLALVIWRGGRYTLNSKDRGGKRPASLVEMMRPGLNSTSQIGIGHFVHANGPSVTMLKKPAPGDRFILPARRRDLDFLQFEATPSAVFVSRLRYDAAL